MCGFSAKLNDSCVLLLSRHLDVQKLNSALISISPSSATHLSAYQPQKHTILSFPDQYLILFLWRKTCVLDFKTLKIFQGLRPWTPLTHFGWVAFGDSNPVTCERSSFNSAEREKSSLRKSTFESYVDHWTVWQIICELVWGSSQLHQQGGF